MKEKLVIMCLKVSIAFEVIAEFIAYPDNKDKEHKVSWLGFHGLDLKVNFGGRLE